jgi:hypothetical protein
MIDENITRFAAEPRLEALFARIACRMGPSIIDVFGVLRPAHTSDVSL